MRKSISITITITIALVWLINGLYCKILGYIPRHQEIVGQILGETYAPSLTIAIGIAEIGMSIWILTRIESRFCTILQMAIIATMNILEFSLAPDLLLFGQMNIVYATLFILLIYVNEFYIKSKN